MSALSLSIQNVMIEGLFRVGTSNSIAISKPLPRKRLSD